LYVRPVLEAFYFFWSGHSRMIVSAVGVGHGLIGDRVYLKPL
jgi:hypothetical protein